MSVPMSLMNINFMFELYVSLIFLIDYEMVSSSSLKLHIEKVRFLVFFYIKDSTLIL